MDAVRRPCNVLLPLARFGALSFFVCCWHRRCWWHIDCIIIYITMIKIEHDKWQREITLVHCSCRSLSGVIVLNGRERSTIISFDLTMYGVLVYRTSFNAIPAETQPFVIQFGFSHDIEWLGVRALMCVCVQVCSWCVRIYSAGHYQLPLYEQFTRAFHNGQ